MVITLTNPLSLGAELAIASSPGSRTWDNLMAWLKGVRCRTHAGDDANTREGQRGHLYRVRLVHPN